MKSNYNPLNLGIVLFLGCAFSAHASNIYISDASSGTILQLGSGESESVFASGLNNPAGLAFDGSGNLYVANSGNGTILRFNSSGNESVFASGLNNPTGLAFGQNGNLYVASQGDGTILQFDLSGNSSVFASGLSNPTYLTFDGGGNLYVSTVHTIEEFNSTGNESTIFGALEFIEGTAVNNDGSLYVAMQNAGFISRVLGGDGPSTPLQYPYNVNPYELAPLGLAFDGNGNLYATFSQLGYFGANGESGLLDGVVMEFDSGGSGSLLTTGLGNPGYIAVQDSLTIPPVQFVPEPSTWALMLAGIGLLIGYRFRRTFPSCVPIRAHLQPRENRRRQH